MKGKNFSANNASGKRRESDFYETPYSMTRQMLGAIDIKGPVLEPASGNGAILRVLSEHGIENEGYDIKGGKSFLDEERTFESVVTNPPFSLAKEFIEKAKSVATSKIVFLLPLSYLHGKYRYDHVYQDTKFPLSRVLVFTRYPMLGDTLREDGKYRTGMMVYAWYVWDKNYQGSPSIGWLDNDEYIIKRSKGDSVDKGCGD